MSDPTGSPAELERQIREARDDLARSVDAIVDRVHPKKVVARSLGRFKQRLGLAGPHAQVAGQHRLERAPESSLPVPKEYLIVAAAAVVVAGGVAVVIWRRSKS